TSRPPPRTPGRASTAGRAGSPPARRSVEELVVRDGELALDEEALVLRVEDGDLDVLAGEALDGLQRLPEGERHELGALAFVVAQDPGAPVTGCRAIFGDSRSLEILDVGVGVLAARPAAPGAGDHGAQPIASTACAYR